MEKNETNPYTILGLGQYSLEEEMKNLNAYDKKIKEKYNALIELAKRKLLINPEEAMRAIKKYDDAYRKICTKEDRLLNYNITTGYLGINKTETKQFKTTQQNIYYYITQLGTLKFSDKEQQLIGEIGKYAVTIVDGNSRTSSKHIIYSHLDLERMESDNEYREFILSGLFLPKSFRLAEENNYGYIGSPIEVENRKSKFGIGYDARTISAVYMHKKELEKAMEEEIVEAEK